MNQKKRKDGWRYEFSLVLCLISFLINEKHYLFSFLFYFLFLNNIDKFFLFYILFQNEFNKHKN